MRRLVNRRALLFCMVFSLLLCACSGREKQGGDAGSAVSSSAAETGTVGAEPASAAEDSYRDDFVGDDKIFVIENEFLRVTVGTSGEILSIVSGDGKRIYLENETAASFSLTLDPDAVDLWKTDPAAPDSLTLTEKDADIQIAEKDGTLEMLGVISRMGGMIRVRRIYALEGSDLKISTVLENGLDQGVVVGLVPAYLSGARGGVGAMDCLWPFKTGTLYRLGSVTDGQRTEDGGTLVCESYPTPISMQLVTLYDDDKTVSYTVEDRGAEYKTFFYKSCADRSASVWCEMLPFAEPGQQKELAPVVISCFDGGDWTVAADRYRGFLASAGWQKTPQPSMNSFTGANGWDLNVYHNDVLTKFTASASAKTEQTLQTSMREIQDRTGMDYMWITGWHEGGFDTYYPDYAFRENMGGEEGFVQGLEELHAQGGKTVLYVNGHMSDTTSEWYNTGYDDAAANGEACATRRADGSVYYETYASSQALDVAMCPSAEPFQDALLKAIEKVRADGIDSLYIDQISEMRSYLCFNPEHGHTTPATAYYEGYCKLLSKVTEVMNRYGTDWFLSCEGVCDCYGKYIDLFCGYADTNFRPLTRYTFPNKIVGRDMPDEDNSNYFSTAFVLGEPFICHRYHVANAQYSNENLKRYLNLYRTYPDLYLRSRYVWRQGLSGDLPAELDAGVLLGEGNQAVIQLYNTSAAFRLPVRFTYTPLTGTVGRAYNIETGEEMLDADGMISLDLDAGQSVSIVVDYE